jgi:hypothetical protein
VHDNTIEGLAWGILLGLGLWALILALVVVLT